MKGDAIRAFNERIGEGKIGKGEVIRLRQVA